MVNYSYIFIFSELKVWTMKLCIAEKPSVAKEIAEILGADEKKLGFYQGNGYQVTWTFGHFCTLKEPHEYNPSWKPWNLSHLPILPPAYEIKLIKNKGVQEQFNIIKYLVKNASSIINCGDAGQEGELIQRWVLEQAKNIKPIERLWISSLTKEAIREGFSNLKDGRNYDPLFEAGKSRAIGDWILGFNATRLYTLRFGNGKQVLSIGRVQTPTLAMIVSRQKEIESFKSQKFWTLETKFKNTLFQSELGKISDKEIGLELLKKTSSIDMEITTNETKEAKESAARLFDLTSLQVTCNNRFSMSAEDTLKTIQNLYEKKLCSYPRVDTTFLPNDVYPKIKGILEGLRVYHDIIQPLLGKTIRKSKNIFNDKKVTDHHAIIPTGQNPVYTLNYQEKIVFDLIAKRFVAAFYPDCLISNTIVKGKIKDILFRTSGKQILDPGWRKVFEKDKKKEISETILPNFILGEKGEHQPNLIEKSTKSPAWHTEGSLLRSMETAGKQVEDEEMRDLMKENGIGRPSTRAAVIETLIRRKYIIKKKRKLVATPIGIQLIDTIENDLLKSPKLTGQWEKKLRDIELGNYKSSVFIKEMEALVNKLVQNVKTRSTEQLFKTIGLKQSKKITNLVCPKCKTGYILTGKKGCGCSNFNKTCDFVIYFNQFEKILKSKQIIKLIHFKKTSLLKGFKQNNVEVDARLLLNEAFEIVLDVNAKQILRCPQCKTGKIITGKKAFGCDRYMEGCKTRIPFKIHEKKITKSQLNELLWKGKTRFIKGFIIDGEKKNGHLKLSENFEIYLLEK